MDVKKEDLYNKLLCLACLSVSRNVYKITNEKLIKYYYDALEIALDKSVQFDILRVCWECKNVLQKCWAFKEQIKDSYRIMQSYTRENFHKYFHTDITKPSRLKIHKVDPIDIPPSIYEECGSLKGELGDVVFEDSTNHYEEDCLAQPFEKNTEDEVFQTELQTIICSFERDGRSKKNVKNEKMSADLTDKDTSEVPILDIKEISNPPSEHEEYTKIPSPVLKGDINEWENTDLQNIISSIEREDKKRSRIKSSVKKKKKKIVKRLKEQKSKYKSKVYTVELSYEEILLEREKEATKEGYIKSEYKCETCILGFNYRKSYQAHVTSKHSPELGDYICPICKTIISSVDSYTTHYKRHMRRYECGICQKRTTDIKVMQQHFYSTHEISLKEYKCDICGKISNSIDTHRYHKDSHKARVQCTECNKTFRHRAGLMNHRLAVHEFHNVFPCTVCDKVFRWKTSLKRHMEKHDIKNTSCSPSAPYCSLCSITFASVCSYQRHLKNSLKHVTQDQHKFICDHCDRRFTDKTKLRDHIEEKHLHRTFQCNICFKQSKNRVGLDQHIRNTHKDRPKDKLCHHCGKGFPTKMQLESHITTHTGERPFVCEYCPSTFSQKSNLNRHNVQVHLNIKSKRYPCKKKKENTEKVPIENTQTDDSYRPILMQYSTEEAPILML